MLKFQVEGQNGDKPSGCFQTFLYSSISYKLMNRSEDSFKIESSFSLEFLIFNRINRSEP